MTIGANEVTFLVDDSNENLAVEYKSWLLFDERKHQADLARHIAARQRREYPCYIARREAGVG